MEQIDMENKSDVVYDAISLCMELTFHRVGPVLGYYGTAGGSDAHE